jgi:EmrB/QacA subfamily drug resistance transporter
MTAEEDTDRLDPGLIKLGGVVVLGAVTSMLDITIVNVAMAGLARQFGASISTIQWVGTGYLLAMAMVIPLTGWSVERFGAKTVWLFSLAVFLSGSLLCGAAWSVESLIVFRVLQGVGGGMILPVGQTILAQAAGPRRLGRVMSVVSLPAQLAPIIGPLIGGVIIDNVSWHWIFWINAPICTTAIVLAWWTVPASTPQPAQKLDLAGLALLSPAVTAIIFGLSEKSTPTVITGAVLLGGFIAHALRTERVPLIDVRLFRNRSFALSSVLLFLARVSIFGAMLLMPLYYQQVQGHSALVTGLLMAPQGIGTMLALALVGRLTDRVGTRPLALAGLAVTVLSMLAFTRLRADTGELVLAGALLIWGIGLATAAVPITTSAYRSLEHVQIPRATSAITIVQSVGGSLGTALLAVILQHRLLVDPSTAFGATFWWAAGFGVLSFAVALALPRKEKVI